MKTFTKQYQKPADLVRLLKSRGLFINDSQKAKH